MSKRQSRNEFRKHKPSGHPTYIYEKVGNKYRFLGITHGPVTRGMKNIKLEHSPDPDDEKDTYVKPIAETDRSNRFGEVKRGWKLSDNDQREVEKIKKANKKRERKRTR